MVCSLVALFALRATDSTPQLELALGGIDPVELVYGRESLGKPSIAYSYLGFEYRFVSDYEKSAFEKDPLRFAVRYGGSCATHGSLLKRGRQSIRATVEGRNYVFCSSTCRERFVQNSSQFISDSPPPPAGDAKEIDRARKLFDRVRLSHGYYNGLASPTVQWVYDSAPDPMRYTFVSNNEFVMWWGSEAEPEYYAVDPLQGPVEKSSSGSHAMHPDEERALRALFYRHPSGILAQDRSSVINIIKNNSGQEIGFVQSVDGITTEIFVSLNTHQIESVRFRDRFNGAISTVEREYSNFYSISGYWMPVSYRLRIDGGRWGPTKTASSLETNCPRPDFLPNQLAKSAWQ